MAENRLTRALRRAALQASLAPSVYNTQPWLLQLGATSLRLTADPERWLASLDRQARQLSLSVGCAVFNARTAVAAARLGTVVDLSTDGAPTDVAATVSAHSHDSDPGDPLRAELNKFVDQPPTPAMKAPSGDTGLAQRLLTACRAEGCQFVALSAPHHRALLRDLARQASLVLSDVVLGPASEWTRAFGPTMWSHARTRFDGDVLPALICTPADTRLDWLHAGQSLQRVLLEAARSGYSAQIYTTPIEDPQLRCQLRNGVPVTDFPQVLLVIGPRTESPPTRRRRLTDILCHKN